MIATAADFQASWFYSILALAVLLLILVGAGYALAGVRRMWANGERAPAAVIAGATIVATLTLLGMYATALGGVIANSAAAGAGG